MLNIFKKLFDSNEKAINRVEPIVDQVFANETKYKDLSISELRAKVETMRETLKPLIEKLPEEARFSPNKEKYLEYQPQEKEIKDKLQEFIPELFAILRELNRQKFGKPHYRVQLIASTILAQGNNLTELKTGEGKTQVFHLPAALYGLTGRGSHVITVNDYLAKRDGEHAGHAMADLGLTVGVITPQASYRFVMDDELEKIKGPEAAAERKEIDISQLSDMKGVNLVECSKQEAYNQNVVYGTNNEFGFDYLRDNMVYELDKRVQGELYFCIIDEADSILIDEARTPLIISAPANASNKMYGSFATIAKKLKVEKHYTVDEKTRSVVLTESGVDYVEKQLNVQNLWEDYSLAHHLDNALKAEALYKKDDEYIVKNGEILIVDEFTGRILPGRRYSEGLHQAIEAKEGVEIKRESRTMATITFQNFFLLYKILAGGSGTIMTEQEEFYKIYKLESFQIPTNKPVIREDKTDKVYKNRLAKFNAVVDEIDRVHSLGQPLLIGTTSIEDSEYISRLLDKRGIEHEVLNAKFHERESQIVAKAGKKNSVTVATNMAGRGTDIPLTEDVVELGGLYIIGTQRHDARRIDNQLRGRAGRQGQPGVSQFFIALDDEIMRIQGGEIVQRLMTATKVPENMPIESALVGRSIESAQKKMEGHHFDTRKRLVDYDNVMNQQREIFYARRYNTILVATKASQEDNAAKEKIEKELQDLLTSETELIVNKHMGLEKPTQEQLVKLTADFLDLANDDSIFAHLEKVSDKSVKVASDMYELLAKLSTREVTELFTKTISSVFKQKLTEFGNDLTEIYKISVLQRMDDLWTDHLDAMGDLREGIGLRGYAQRDPLVEYKNEAFLLFENFINNINSQISRTILKIRKVAAAPKSQPTQTNEQEVTDVLTGSREMLEERQSVLNSVGKGKGQPKRLSGMIKRNEPCPCGSGLKYKKCGLINAPQHKT